MGSAFGRGSRVVTARQATRSDSKTFVTAAGSRSLAAISATEAGWRQSESTSA